MSFSHRVLWCLEQLRCAISSASIFAHHGTDAMRHGELATCSSCVQFSFLNQHNLLQDTRWFAVFPSVSAQDENYRCQWQYLCSTILISQITWPVA